MVSGVEIRDLESNDVKLRLDVGGRAPDQVFYSRDGTLLGCFSHDAGMIAIYDLRTTDQVVVITGLKGESLSPAMFSPLADRILVEDEEATKLYDIKSRLVLADAARHARAHGGDNIAAADLFARIETLLQ
jgi:hypothetical protein